MAAPRLRMDDVRRRAGEVGPGTRLPIGPAAQRVGSTPRMLRYREALGLLPRRRRGGQHRVYGERELLAAACAAELEERHDVSPRTLAFALHVLSDPVVEADVRLLGALSQRLASTPIAALDFDAQKARRLLELRRGDRDPVPD